MVLLLLLSPVLQAQDFRQPTTMEVVGYQRVQHALPDGRPDLKAPDNYYIQTRTQWYLQADSDTLPVDQSGNYQIHLPEMKATLFERYEEKGRAKGKLADAFTEIWPFAKKGTLVERGSMTSGAMDYTRHRKQRVLHWWIRSVTTKVETHTLGKHRATRTLTSTEWSSSTQGWETGKPWIPNTDPMVTFEPGKHVVDAPTYGYSTVVALPGDKDF